MYNQESNRRYQASFHSAIRFIVLLGLVSLFSDVTYEGARSILGPFMANLGATATAVGFVFGLAEFIGYGVRLVSGYLGDKTNRPWLIVILGYCVNLFSVPMLALARQWQTAAGMVFGERLGKAIRTPVRDSLLSHATTRTGRGWGFGLHEAMDQIGAIIGPVLMTFVLFAHDNYRFAFSILLIPATFSILTLFVARLYYPHPKEFELQTPTVSSGSIKKTLWSYMIAAGFIALGYADFPLIAFRLQRDMIATAEWVPLFYATAMAADALAAITLGKLFDRHRFKILLVSIVLSAGFAPLVFLGNFLLSLIGMALWGIGMGAQESILRAGVSLLSPPEKRASIFGVYHAVFGMFWFCGSVFMGFLLDHAVYLLILFSLLTQCISLALFWKVCHIK